MRVEEHQQTEVTYGDHVRGESLEVISAYSPTLNPALCKPLDGRTVVRSPQQLRIHGALAELGLTVTTEELNEAVRLDTRSSQEPILIATDGTILEGLGRWKVALLNGKQEIHCIEYQLSDEDCLRFILIHHQPRRGWNAFVRTRLALTLEPVLQQRALENMRVGGKYKGLANLPNLHRIDVRQEVSKLAGVGARTVGNVKIIVKFAHPRLVEALRSGTLTINGAIQLCKFSRSEQVEQFSRSREERAISKVIRRAIAQSKGETQPDIASLLEALQRQEQHQPGSVEVRLGMLQRTVIVLGRDMTAAKQSQKELKLT